MVIFVALGIAQWVIDFVFWIHFIEPVFKIEAFDPVRMLALLAVTSALGFTIGYVLAPLWNGVQKKPTSTEDRTSLSSLSTLNRHDLSGNAD